MAETHTKCEEHVYAEAWLKQEDSDPLRQYFQFYPDNTQRIRILSGSYASKVSKRRRSLWDLYKVATPQREKQPRFLTHLERAANAGNLRSFVNLLKGVNWDNKRAQDFEYVIKLALNLSAPTAAQYVYDEGMKRRPESPEITRYTRLFAPSRSSTRTLPPNPTLKANREWLRSHRAEYRGQWIAIRNGELLASAASLEDLTSHIGETANTLLTRA